MFDPIGTIGALMIVIALGVFVLWRVRAPTAKTRALAQKAIEGRGFGLIVGEGPPLGITKLHLSLLKWGGVACLVGFACMALLFLVGPDQPYSLVLALVIAVLEGVGLMAFFAGVVLVSLRHFRLPPFQ